MIKFKNEPVTLRGTQCNVNDVLSDFRVVDNGLNDVELKNLKGKVILLSVPSLDTPVCSMEVAKFIQLVRQRKDVTCISVSMDLPFALDRWCLAQENTNVLTTSDYKYHEFEKVSGTMIEELGLLTRAVFVLDEEHRVRYVEYVDEVTNEPDYDRVIEELDRI